MSKQFNAKGLHFAEAWQEGKCVGCAHCAEICPDGAIEIAQAQESLPTPPKPERPAPQRLHEILAGTASGHSSKGDR